MAATNARQKMEAQDKLNECDTEKTRKESDLETARKAAEDVEAQYQKAKGMYESLVGNLPCLSPRAETISC
ncbi:MAG: hypothetical protein CL912_13910 [Deltaproteobacteria bacterium]|nr:hypothetical protein [Deltaproteobacteria bacterium]